MSDAASFAKAFLKPKEFAALADMGILQVYRAIGAGEIRAAKVHPAAPNFRQHPFWAAPGGSF